jgi:hypothetical protein
MDRMITFSQMMSMWQWSEISNCPGRYTLDGGPTLLGIEDLVGFEVEIRTHVPPSIRDPVLLAVFPDFGIISYKRADGRLVHTLNTVSGLERKLRALGISV